MERKRIFNSESGQALLIIVLVMVVVLTAGLSLALRSVTNLRTATEEENSQRAFFAAEAGIEQALKLNQSGSVIENRPLGNNAIIRNVNVTDVAGSSFILNGGNPVRQDDGADVWLAPRNADGTVNDATVTSFTGNISIYWGVQTVSDACAQAAIEVVTLSGTKTSPVSTRYTFDECATRRGTNNFASGGVGVGAGVCTGFPYKAPPITGIGVSQGLIARIIPLYSDSPFCIVASGPLPSQGRIIESVGVAGGTERKVLLFQGHPKVPAELFQYILFSPR